jgi:D-sedoheptulose 7-phosphate isomerase
MKEKSMDALAYCKSEFDEHRIVFEETAKTMAEPFTRLVDMAEAAIKGGGKIMLFGNGGSAADAQHLATELTVRYIKDRAPIAAIALTTDTSALSAIGNDMGFEFLFSRQVEALGKKGDLAIGISTSGRSPNVIRALTSARQMGIATAGFTGGSGGYLGNVCDLMLVIPSTTTARIQEMHIMLGQMLCGALERRLGLAV